MWYKYSIKNNHQYNLFFNLIKIIEQNLTDKPTKAETVLNLIKQFNISASEIDDLKLKTYLQNNPVVYKQTLLSFLRSNAFNIVPSISKDKEFENFSMAGGNGKNYQEHLFQLNSKENPLEIQNQVAILSRKIIDLENKSEEFEEEGKEELANNCQIQIDKIQNKLDKLDNLVSAYPRPYNSSHYKKNPNVLFHLRTTDRTDINNKKLLHLDEIQSDWHQSGRKNGYEGELPTGYTLQSKKFPIGGTMYWITDQNGKDVELGNNKLFSTPEEAIQSCNNAKQSVPQAPFKKTWHEIALKHALDYAAKNGYHGISWTPGEVHGNIYGMSKQIDAVYYNTMTKKLQCFLGGEVVLDVACEESEIFKHIGKNLASQLVNTPNLSPPYDTNVKKLSNINSSIGDEGMKQFYNGIVPQYLSKYTKKLGGQVSQTQIKSDPDLEEKRTRATSMLDIPDKLEIPSTETIPYLEITPEMRKEYTENGQKYAFNLSKIRKF